MSEKETSGKPKVTAVYHIAFPKSAGKITLKHEDLVSLRDQINEILGEDKPESPWPLPRWRPDEIIGPDSVRNPQGVKITYTNGTGHE